MSLQSVRDILASEALIRTEKVTSVAAEAGRDRIAHSQKQIDRSGVASDEQDLS